MTKVQLHYELLRPLDATDEEGVSNLHSVYGIQRVSVAPSLASITVDYDASRLSERDVESVLIRYGLPIRRQTAAAG